MNTIHTQVHNILKICIKSTLILSFFYITFSNTAFAEEKPLIVAELFTSEFCPTCVPAEKIFASLAAQENIIPLSCHVTYHNRDQYIDPASREFCDLRQYGYIGKTESEKIYTPQIVINGGEGFIGTRRKELNSAMKAAYENPIKTIPLRLDNNTLRFETIELPRGKRLTYNIWVFEYTPDNKSIVTNIINIGKWDGAIISQEIPLSADTSSAAVIIQEKGYGRIVAAGKIEL